MQIHIRTEQEADIPAVQHLIREAFKMSQFGLQGEDDLVSRLRTSKAFIPQLSLVAKDVDHQDSADKVVGHILLTEVLLREADLMAPALALAPLSVHPDYQRQGIGGQLVMAAHQVASALDHCCIVLLGHDRYYPRFGYRSAHEYNVSFPFDLPLPNCMLFVLHQQKMNFSNAQVCYPPEWQIELS